MNFLKNTLLKSLSIVAVATLMFSCQTDTKPEGQEDPEMQKLKAEIEELRMKNEKKDSSFYSLVMTFNEIDENLKEIKQREGIINMNAEDNTEMDENKKESVISDIQTINSLLQENKKRVATLRAQLNKSNLENKEAEQFLASLTAQIEEREQQISVLKDQLAGMQISMKLLNMENMEQQEVIEMQTSELNTAFFAFGTAKELEENGVITKEGGFIGIGKIAKLKEDFEKAYFTKIDVTETKEIALHVKDAKVITTHPSDSYTLDRDDKTVNKIIITNTDKFWAASKYLVIVVEN